MASPASLAAPTDAAAGRCTARDVRTLCDRVTATAAARGLDAALREHAVAIGGAWLAHPRTLSRRVAAWLAADPATRPLLPAAEAARVTAAAATAAAAPSTASSTSSSDGEGGDDGRVAAARAGRRPDPPVPGVDEADGSPVTVYRRGRWRNWASTQRAVPALTFVPSTVAGVVAIVRHALAEGLRVRVSGTRHSWSDVFGGDGGVMVAMAPPAFAEGTVVLPPNVADTELEAVRLLRETTDADGRPVGLVHVGAAATADHVRAWSRRHRQWALPALPILVEITFGGSISALCHGSGLTHAQTVADLVAAVTFVNARGVVQTVDDPVQLRAAAGCFGLLGVVVAYTLRAVPMGIAAYAPRAVPTPLAVPPLARADVPRNRDFAVADYTDDELAAAAAAFGRDARRFYAEWFWFPYQADCWVNAWGLGAPDPGDDVRPDAADVRAQNVQAALGRVYEQTLLRLLPGRVQARQLGDAAMALLPSSGRVMPTLLSEALHFRRGIHRMPVRDMEAAIPLPPRPDDPAAPDLRPARAAWWAAIQEVYARLPAAPMRTTLEMRVTAGSDMLLSSQRGNAVGTAHIEVLTNTVTPEAEWSAFTQALMDRWTALTDAAGRPLNVRTHWAKEWPPRMRGVPIVQDMRQTAYRDALPEFKATAGAVAAAGGYTLADALRVFGHDTFTDLLA